MSHRNSRGPPALATAVARSYGIHAFGHAVGSRDDEEPMLDAKHGLPELPWMEAGLCGSIIIARARRSCFVYAGRDSLIARSDRHRLRYNAD